MINTFTLTAENTNISVMAVSLNLEEKHTIHFNQLIAGI